MRLFERIKLIHNVCDDFLKGLPAKLMQQNWNRCECNSAIYKLLPEPWKILSIENNEIPAGVMYFYDERDSLFTMGVDVATGSDAMDSLVWSLREHMRHSPEIDFTGCDTTEEFRTAYYHPKPIGRPLTSADVEVAGEYLTKKPRSEEAIYPPEPIRMTPEGKANAHKFKY